LKANLPKKKSKIQKKPDALRPVYYIGVEDIEFPSPLKPGITRPVILRSGELNLTASYYKYTIFHSVCQQKNHAAVEKNSPLWHNLAKLQTGDRRV
jgi:hypothetical protein